MSGSNRSTKDLIAEAASADSSLHATEPALLWRHRADPRRGTGKQLKALRRVADDEVLIVLGVAFRRIHPRCSSFRQLNDLTRSEVGALFAIAHSVWHGGKHALVELISRCEADDDQSSGAASAELTRATVTPDSRDDRTSLKWWNGWEGAEECLACPECGDGYLHQLRVEVFWRDEDAPPADQKRVDSRKADHGWEVRFPAGRRNPSRRRDGLLVDFVCEQCGGLQTLAIAQHKGNTLVYWRGTGSAEPD